MTIPPPDPEYIIKGDMGPIHSLMFLITPHTEHLYAGAESGKIHIWNLRNNREAVRLTASNESCLAMHTINEELFITQRKGGAINFWKSHNSTWVMNKTFNTDYYGFSKIQKSSENDLFIPLSDSKIGLFSTKTFKIETELNPKSIQDSACLGLVMGIKPCIDEYKYVLVMYDGGLLYLWDVRAKNIVSSLEVEKSPMSIDFSSTLKHGIIGSPSNHLEIFSLFSDCQLLKKTKLPLKNPGISTVAIRPDEKVFTTGGWDSRLRIYSWKSLRPLAVLDHHKETIQDIIYSNSTVDTYNAKYLMAVAGKEGNISLWNLYNS